MIILSFVCITITILLLKHVYSYLTTDSGQEMFLAKGITSGKVVLGIIGSLTEPDPISFFIKWSTGKH